MYQQTHTVQDHENKTVYEANRRSAQSFVGILQAVWGITRHIGAAVLNGFHSFVASAEPQRPSNNDYWWNSPEVAEEVFKR